jgi:hypothetical protein
MKRVSEIVTLHLIKLCVGVEHLEQLVEWQHRRHELAQSDPTLPPLSHVTRMMPKRKEELLDGGSLYWVIKGVIQVRQGLLDLERFTDEEGISRCRMVLDPALVPTMHQPKRPFQGWRYLKDEEAPRDLKELGKGAASMSPEMQAELAELGLI